jgi:hypothetical protein
MEHPVELFIGSLGFPVMWTTAHGQLRNEGSGQNNNSYYYYRNGSSPIVKSCVTNFVQYTCLIYCNFDTGEQHTSIHRAVRLLVQGDIKLNAPMSYSKDFHLGVPPSRRYGPKR